MNILFSFLGAVLFLDCILLIFLVLLQLPKKEAGAGMAFGGAATDALFGAGSGNALTTITKGATWAFFLVALMMALITSHRAKPTDDLLEKKLTSPGAAAPATPGPSSPGVLDFNSHTNAATAATNTAPVTMPTTPALATPATTN